MAKTLFILGLPGSGKSTVARLIKKKLFEKARLKVIRLNDFKILEQMFECDSDHLFRKAETEGVFDVLDLRAYDIALKRLEEEVEEAIREEGEEAFYIIEFSRNNYEQAFTLFDPKFLADAYYLHLETSQNICKERVRDRAFRHDFEDDYPVSDFIFEQHYRGDDGKYLPAILKKYSVDKDHVLTLHNDGLFEVIVPAIEKFATSALLVESKKPEPQPVS